MIWPTYENRLKYGHTQETTNKASLAGCLVIAPLLTYCLVASATPENRFKALIAGLVTPFALWAFIHGVFTPSGFGKMSVAAQWALVLALLGICIFL